MPTAGDYAVAPFEIVAGPADVYIADVATAFPATNDDHATTILTWAYLGKTEGGVAVRHTQDTELITTDQTTGPLKAVRTSEGLEIEFSLAETTVENYAVALGRVTVTTDAGTPTDKRIYMHRGRIVNQSAFLVRRDSPYGAFIAQYEVPVTVQVEEPEVEYTADDKTVLHVQYTALEDPAAATDDERFGTLRARSA